MSLTQTTGLIIKEQKVGEADRLVTILTKDLGLVRAFAPKALKINSKSLTSTQLLSYSSLTVYQSRDTYKINDARSIEVFFGLRADIEALSLASYFCELLLNLAPVAENAENYLKLTLNCLYLLTNKKRSIDFLKSVFEMKIAEYSGYCPDLVSCAKCGKEVSQNVSFDYLNGVIYCEKCANEGLIKIPNSVLGALRHIIYAPQEKLFSFKLNESSEKCLAEVSERFIIATTERGYKTLDFLKQMRI